MNKLYLLLAALFTCSMSYAQELRSRTNFDDGWYFAFGHPSDKSKDFGTGTAYFTYFAKARYGADGATTMDFDHRSWRPIDLPHDWAVEMPFDSKGSHSHGYKAVGPGFPDVSVGWYRKVFRIEGKHGDKQYFLDFDGVSRDSRVWVNGHYLGNVASGYQSFSYNITDIINYGEDNTVAVRADVSMEEGWYYEGAGIYRHVWLRETSNLHVPKDGIFVRSEVMDNSAKILADIEVDNRAIDRKGFSLVCELIDTEGKIVAESKGLKESLNAMQKGKYFVEFEINKPNLWELENPYLYLYRVKILDANNTITDKYDERVGIRTIEFTADKGFFLNGKHVKLQGTNNHQDHAGVGCAIPNELLRWRLQQLKNFGSNAIRSSHNPPTPELLDLCDEIGILVIDENRLMGTTENALSELEHLIKRDRNHPSVILWSIGNEEWGIEWNEIGARMTETMQKYANLLDPTRPANVAVSGGWDDGSGAVVDVMGFNYLVHGDTDEHHKKFPTQPSVGTEEGSTYTTRGIYYADDALHYKSAYDVKPLADWFTIQECWKHYASRDYLAGMFIWTGFDYRGEPTPYKWPSVTSYFGMMDLCGFPKDNVFYLKSWWQNEPVLHILPHWNWEGREGESIDVWVYSNCDEVELSLNGKKLGRKKVEKLGHVSWKVAYKKGTLKAVGYKDGTKILESERITAGKPASIKLSASKSLLKADNKDVSVFTVEVLDEKGTPVPTAMNEVEFELEGAGKIIGIGNGNPTSLEKERFIDDYKQIYIDKAQISDLSDTDINMLKNEGISQDADTKVFRVSFSSETEIGDNQSVTWYYNSVGTSQSLYLNGKLIEKNVSDSKGHYFSIDRSLVKKGKNLILVFAKPYTPANEWDEPNTKVGSIQIKTTADKWKRKLFNGLAQVIVQSNYDEGDIVLRASSKGLSSSEFRIVKSK
ncbi:MAG: beta-galactosidase GalA [Bacteroidales bacterium]